MKRRDFLIAASVSPLVLTGVSQAESKYKKGNALPENIEELHQFMNSRLPVGPATCIQWSVTGEDYAEYSMRTDQNPPPNAQAHICAAVWRMFLIQIENTGTDARLYWRVKPEHVSFGAGEYFDGDGELLPGRVERIYLRYLVSSKPELKPNGDPEHDKRVSFIRSTII